jgi:glyoxylase-like metal-dependent hydrolase (beta-lactamase superfamily II)
VDVQRIAPGLWRWTAPHPEWKPRSDWERDVGCVYWEGDGAVVLVDPLGPAEPGESERFWSALDRDVERRAQPVAVLVTCAWHRRSADEVVARYDGTLHAPVGWERLEGASRADPEKMLPGGAVAIPAPPAEEALFWLPAARTLVPGDTILGGDEGLALCPASWLARGATTRDLVEALRPALELDVERVLCSHGPPLLEGGREALRELLG